MSKRYPPIRHEVDSGDVTAYATHVGDGYYLALFKCRVCGDEATREHRLPKDKVKPIWDAWAQEHWHHP